ncbi:sulfur carrier protein ThiS [Bifidobacterium scardovii]|uniref:ThiS protein n=1 Tax=Bifidobacterium scardovii TaxID=158787 RepID=A0A087DDL5_9BIFI|nr:sulfur carrier protein ThiS [Bifidobacterium scardovii]KFI93615.1 ThiS protein [Bifidobacterium scardovii]MBS6947685.1 sulfur carrier protein ThiS [Bifidobacterium scardovii]MDK6348627.1 sulfur carrier protein ThiS [Bifidobacterium scardovii]MDU2421640.1 sulfur carrier protein ThiS [Bifidobacterium scardovii]MDU3737255.1 sulfur carrier protein ThiS [Bifidobacterium scardovii]
MIVNGKEEQIETPLSVNDLIERLGFTPERVAVELNGAIVPRVKRAETMLKGTDTVEIVTFVQGG